MYGIILSLCVHVHVVEIKTRWLPYRMTTILRFNTVKVGSEYDASPRHKRDAEIEINPIHAFECRGLACICVIL